MSAQHRTESCSSESESRQAMEKAGRVTHYYPKIGVVVLEVAAPLRVGDRIRIKGTITDFEQNVESMEIEHEKVKEAKPGNFIGLKVEERVREKDVVYKLLE